MSDTKATVTKEELGEWLGRDQEKKVDLADRIGVSPRTIEGWRNGRTIQEKYREKLRKVMTGEDLIGVNLRPEIHAILKKKAKAKGYTNVEAFISEFAKGFLSIALLFAFGHQVFHPENGQARRFGRRRDESACVSVDVEGDA